MCGVRGVGVGVGCRVECRVECKVACLGWSVESGEDASTCLMRNATEANYGCRLHHPTVAGCSPYGCRLHSYGYRLPAP